MLRLHGLGDKDDVLLDLGWSLQDALRGVAEVVAGVDDELFFGKHGFKEGGVALRWAVF